MTPQEQARLLLLKLDKHERDHVCAQCDGDEIVSVCRALIAAEERVQELERALHVVTDRMDRSGGDRDGMPECPWCRAGPDGDDHADDCELLIARAALAKGK